LNVEESSAGESPLGISLTKLSNFIKGDNIRSKSTSSKSILFHLKRF